MSSRTFTVFQDASPVKKRTSLRPLGRSASAAAVLTTSRRSQNNAVSLPEKENLHPLTGTSLGNGSASLGKKRKASESSSVLAPKVLGIASEVSGSAKQKRTELKRKAHSQSGPGKAKVKKENLTKIGKERKALSDVDTTSTRKPGTRPGSFSTSSSALATIKEEGGAEVAKGEKPGADAKLITQALIDSRCYELTVSPLADVSHAYLQSSGHKNEVETEVPADDCKEISDFETQLWEYFALETRHTDSQSSDETSTGLPTPLVSTPDETDMLRSFDFAGFYSTNGATKSTPVTPKKSHRLARSLSLPNTPTKGSAKEKEDAQPHGSVMLSTPERRELYATFTFTTPKSSPTRIF